MDFEIDNQTKELFKKIPLDIKRRVLNYLKTQAESERQKLQGITPTSVNINSSHLRDAWKVYSGINGSVVLNTKTANDKKKSKLAYLLNNYGKTKHYQFFDKWWSFEQKSLEDKVTKDVNKIIENLTK